MRHSLLICIVLCCGCGVRDKPRPFRPNRPVISDVAPAAPASIIPVRAPDPPVTPVRNEPDPVVHVTPPARRDPAAVIQQTNGVLQDIFFEYDRSDLRPGSLAALQQDAALLIPILRDFLSFTVFVEGHCDERGSAEYNLGLGDHRAGRVAEMLTGLGVPAAQVRTISYGREMPQCVEASESCWQRNRRAHLRLASAE